METDEKVSLPSDEAIGSVERLFNAIHIRFPRAVTVFESKWAAWDEACLTETTSSASIDACVQVDEFETLKRLGPKIIPFVVFKLAKVAEQNSHGVFLYNALEKDPNYRVASEEVLVSKEDLRRHGSQIVELNYQRNKIVNDRVEAWKQHHQDNWLQSNSGMFTFCDEYWDLLEMGPSIIAHLMIAYVSHPEDYWYELLHEIVHGHKLGAHCLQKWLYYDECCRFFNEGEHDQAPKYVQTQWDRWYYHGEKGPEVQAWHDRFRRY